MVQFLFQQSIYMTLQFGKSLINLLLEQSGSQIYSWTQNRFANMEYFNVFLLHCTMLLSPCNKVCCKISPLSSHFTNSNFSDKIFGYYIAGLVNFTFNNFNNFGTSWTKATSHFSSNLTRFLEGCVSNMTDEFNVMQKRPAQIFCVVPGNKDIWEIFAPQGHWEKKLLWSQIGLCANLYFLSHQIHVSFANWQWLLSTINSTRSRENPPCIPSSWPQS